MRGAGYILAVAALAVTLPAQAGEHGGAITVSAVVMPHARMGIMRQAPRIMVTPMDIRRGYIDSPRASVLAVTATRGAGYSIDFLPRSELFTAVRIAGFEGEVAFNAEGGTVSQRNNTTLTAGTRPLELSYRFFLAPGVTEGEYAWPLAMTIRGS